MFITMGNSSVSFRLAEWNAVLTRLDDTRSSVRGKTRSRTMVYMLLGVLVFVLVVGTVLLSVYFGIKMAQDYYKEYEATFIDYDGTLVHEKIIVTDTEEVFSNDFATGIADFSKGLLTIKLKKSEFPSDQCYVTNMNLSDFRTPKEFTSKHETSLITFEAKHVTIKYEVTDIRLNIKALGHTSSELCKGKKVFFLREKTDQTTSREKRNTCQTTTYVNNTCQTTTYVNNILVTLTLISLECYGQFIDYDHTLVLLLMEKDPGNTATWASNWVEPPIKNRALEVVINAPNEDVHDMILEKKYVE